MEALLLAIVLSAAPVTIDLPDACDITPAAATVCDSCRRRPVRRCIVAVAKGVNFLRPFHRRFRRR